MSKIGDIPAQELTGRVAKAIEVAQRRGFTGPWSLARFAILAMADASREEAVCEAEIIEKTTPKVRQYSKIARKSWETRKRRAAALAQAEAAKSEEAA